MENERHLLPVEQPTTKLNFGTVLMELKLGAKVSREGWNGKGMYLYLTQGKFDFKDENVKSVEGIDLRSFDQITSGETKLPYITMKTALNSHVPWLASQTDMLAEDWCILKD